MLLRAFGANENEAQSRTINLYGERCARADRNVVVSGQYAPRPTACFMLWSMILFGIPMTYLNRWNAIWVDRVTYTREWRKMTKEIVEEWLYGSVAVSIDLRFRRPKLNHFLF
jgi:hypothetical protein